MSSHITYRKLVWIWDIDQNAIDVIPNKILNNACLLR